MGPEDRLGIYISVPFCRAKCTFCNFASGVGNGAALETYVTRLCAEIEAAACTAARLDAELPRSVDTVYLGGGTPSLLQPAQLERILAALARNFDCTADAEITLEAAPGQIAPEVLEQAQRCGVNRISLGVQSFVDRECAAVGRQHTASQCVQEFERLRAAGCAELGADLIAGLPYQTSQSWEHSLDVACGLAAQGVLTHLSVYMLEVDEDSRLGGEVLAGGSRFHAPQVPPADVAAEFYVMACERLAAGHEGGSGFRQYEISNFAATGAGPQLHTCRHNLKYWTRQPYLGFGLDAHSMLYRNGGGSAQSAFTGPITGKPVVTNHAAVRLAQPDDLSAYMAAREPEVVAVGEREGFEETVFLELRLADGLDLERLRSAFPQELTEPCEEAAQELLAAGLMIEQDDCWRLTLRGRMVSNEIFGRLLLTGATV